VLWEAMNDATLIARRGLLARQDHGSLEHITLHPELGVLPVQPLKAGPVHRP
jgi:hypothetical protein